jgi:hypothetical protein
VFYARQHDLGSWIVHETILACHPLKDTLDGLQSGVLRAEAEGAGRWACGSDRAGAGIVPGSAACSRRAR